MAENLNLFSTLFILIVCSRQLVQMEGGATDASGGGGDIDATRADCGGDKGDVMLRGCPERFVNACKNICGGDDDQSACKVSKSQRFDEGFIHCVCRKGIGNIKNKYECQTSTFTSWGRLYSEYMEVCRSHCKSINRVPHYCQKHYKHNHKFLPTYVCACADQPKAHSEEGGNGCDCTKSQVASE